MPSSPGARDRKWLLPISGTKPMAVSGMAKLKLLSASDAGQLRIAIGRASDFFGAGVTESTLGERVFAKALAGKPVDFLFIDGDHTEKGVEQDFENYRGLVRPGGLIAFHDIAPNQKLATNQVQHFWKRIRGQHDTHESIADPKQIGFGIGVLRVPTPTVK